MFTPDQIVTCLSSTCSQQIDKKFSYFLGKNGIKKWLVATDFCIGDSTRFNDTFAYTVFPYDAYLDEINDEINTISPKDIKKIKRVNENMLNYLRSSRRFTFCFVPSRERQWVPDLETAQKCMDDTIIMMKSWQDADKQHHLIKEMLSLRQEMEFKNFNIKLLGDIILTAIFSGFVLSLIAKYSFPEVIGWFPDRDKITEAYQKVAFSLSSINFSAFCQQQEIPHDAVKITFGVPNAPEGSTKGIWFDPLIRIPDYIAGTIAAWDWENHDYSGDNSKFQQIVEQVVAGNENIKLIRLIYNDKELYASRVDVSKIPKLDI